MGSVSSKHSLGRALSDSASSWALYRTRRFPLSSPESQSINLFSTAMQKKPYVAVIGAGGLLGGAALFFFFPPAPRVFFGYCRGRENNHAPAGATQTRSLPP